MKKFFFLTLVLVVLFASVIPVSAAPVKPVEPKLFMLWPDKSNPGETHLISLTATNTGKNPVLLNWKIVFSKLVVSAVKIKSGAKMLQDQSTADNWVYSWKKAMKPGVSVTVEFQITIEETFGLHNLIEVYTSKGALLGSGEINVLVPNLTWTITAPDLIVYGSRPVSIIITAYNSSNVDMPFDVAVEMFHNATDRSFHYQASGGEVYDWKNEYYTSVLLYWRGTVPAGGKYILNLLTGSGINLGYFKLLTVKDLSAGTMITEHSYQLVKGEGIPYGKLYVYGPRDDGRLIQPGDMVTLESYYYSPAISQFQITRVDSKCPIQGLPGGSTSNYWVTYAYTKHYVTILPMEKPAGVTGPYTVTCNITSTFNMLGDINTKYYGTGSFEVTIP